jgi:hypothetical protein
MGAATQPIFPKPNPILPWSRSPLAASAGVGFLFIQKKKKPNLEFAKYLGERMS